MLSFVIVFKASSQKILIDRDTLVALTVFADKCQLIDNENVNLRAQNFQAFESIKAKNAQIQNLENDVSSKTKQIRILCIITAALAMILALSFAKINIVRLIINLVRKWI